MKVFENYIPNTQQLIILDQAYSHGEEFLTFRLHIISRDQLRQDPFQEKRLLNEEISVCVNYNSYFNRLKKRNDLLSFELVSPNLYELNTRFFSDFKSIEYENCVIKSFQKPDYALASLKKNSKSLFQKYFSKTDDSVEILWSGNRGFFLKTKNDIFWYHYEGLEVYKIVFGKYKYFNLTNRGVHIKDASTYVSILLKNNSSWDDVFYFKHPTSDEYIIDLSKILT